MKGGLKEGSRDLRDCFRDTSIWFSASCSATRVKFKTMMERGTNKKRRFKGTLAPSLLWNLVTLN